ncbi:hypothetical protein ACHQM5_015574 [Ranunculus cassubicifolius]
MHNAMPQTSVVDDSAGTTTANKATKSFGKSLEDVEISVPIIYGSTSFWLGEKANQHQTHKWTVYVRSALYEDLGVVIKRAVFKLHPSFDNPVRVVKSPPFELSGSSCGEFKICIRLVFHKYVCAEKLDLYHHLKLYPEEESCAWSTKKPIVAESREEILVSAPFKGFYARVQNHPAVVPRLPLTKYPLVNKFLWNCSEKFNLFKKALLDQTILKEALTPKEVDVEMNYLRKQVQQLQQQVQGIQLLEYNDYPDDSDDEVSTDEEDLNPFYRNRVRGVFNPDSDSDTEVPESKGKLPAIDLKSPPVFDDYEELSVNIKSPPVFDRELTFCNEEVLLSQVHQFVKFQDGKVDNLIT